MHTVKQPSLPLFFEQLTDFRELIPSGPGQPILDQRRFHLLLNSYLEHYQMHFMACGLAQSHDIWQSPLDAETPRQNTHEQPQHYQIVQQYWQVARPVGTFIIAHGYFDHSGLYSRLIDWALKRSYNVLCFDLPGHGLSSGQPAAIDSFNTYTDALIMAMSHLPDKNNHQRHNLPLCALGQSTGCSVIVNALFKEILPQPLARIILLAPLVRSFGWERLRYLYFALRPFIRSVKRHFIASSHHHSFNQFLQHHDPLQATRIPLNWLGAMDTWYQQSKPQQDLLPKAPQRLHIIQGTEDTTIDRHYNVRTLQQHFPNSRTYPIPGAKHNLANESEPYWTMIKTHLDSIISETG